MGEIIADKTYDIFAAEEPVPNSEREKKQGCQI